MNILAEKHFFFFFLTLHGGRVGDLSVAPKRSILPVSVIWTQFPSRSTATKHHCWALFTCASKSSGDAPVVFLSVFLRGLLSDDDAQLPETMCVINLQKHLSHYFTACKSGSVNTCTPEFSLELVLNAKYGGRRLARSAINPKPQL